MYKSFELPFFHCLPKKLFERKPISYIIMLSQNRSGVKCTINGQAKGKGQPSHNYLNTNIQLKWVGGK